MMYAMKCRAAVTLLATVALVGVAHGAESETAKSPMATAGIPTEAAQLRDLVARLDQSMFDAYNAHDADGLMAWFTEDLEFYHDTGGLMDVEQVKTGFTNVFANNKDIRRDLVDGSLEVYPIKDYGAIEIGAHRFCHTENGKPVCGTYRFMQIWRFTDGAWKVSREVSYGH
jgi:ketosteroid isomerase-like protein